MSTPNHGPLLNERYNRALDTLLLGKEAPVPASEFARLAFEIEILVVGEGT